MREWKEEILVDCLESLIDYRGKTPKKSDSGIITLSAKSVKMGKIDYSQAYYISPQEYKKFMVRGFPQKGDILMTTEAPLGCIAKLDRNDVSVAQRLLTLRGKKDVLDNEYLMYYLMSRRGQYELLSRASGSTVQGIKRSEFENVLIVLPDLGEQKEIAKTLSNLDKKITLLRQQNQDLEELAQTLFKRWFVEFEFPCLPHDYHPSGQVNLSDIAKVCTYKRVGGIPAPNGQNWFVYVLLCEDDSFYKGMTNDLYRRFYEHYIGQGAKHTQAHKPVKVIHWEQFDTQEEAHKREEELKTGYGRTWLQRQWEKAQGGLPAPECQLRMAGKMVESELGDLSACVHAQAGIPEGWELKPLDKIVKVHNGYSYKGIELQESNTALVTLKNFDRNGGFRLDGFKELVSDKFKEKHVVSVGDLIVAHTDLTQDAEVLGNPAIIMKNGKYNELVMSMDLVKVESLEEDITVEFLYYLMRDKRFKYHCKGYANGTTVLHLSKSAIPEYLFPFPFDLQLIKDFGSYAKSVYKKITTNIEEIQTLTQLRDTLLPKLMSGELRVKN